MAAPDGRTRTTTSNDSSAWDWEIIRLSSPPRHLYAGLGVCRLWSLPMFVPGYNLVFSLVDGGLEPLWMTTKNTKMIFKAVNASWTHTGPSFPTTLQGKAITQY